MKFTPDDFKLLLIGITTSTIGQLTVQFINADKKKWLEEHPMAIYRFDLTFYRFNVYFYYPFFSFIFPVYGIIYSLFAPEYDTLPRYTAAWIFFGIGLAATILFKHLKRDYDKPVKPI